MGLKLFCVSIFIFVVMVVQQVPLSAQAPYNYRPTVGEKHVEFELPSVVDRELIRLSDYRGKKLLLFHFASW